MPHGDTIVDGNRIKFGCETAHLFNFSFHNLTNLMKMGMTRYKLGERVHNGNNRFTKLFLFHTCGHPKGTGASHSTTFGADCTSQLMLHIIKYLNSEI